MGSTTAAFLTIRDIRVINSPQGVNFCWGTRAVGQPTQTVKLGIYNTTDGNSYVDTSNLGLPIGIIVTSIKCVADPISLATTDRIRLTFTGGPVLDSMLSATDITKNELIPSNKKGICVVSTVSSWNSISATYNLGGTPNTAKTAAYIELTYRALQSNNDLNTATLVPVLV